MYVCLCSRLNAPLCIWIQLCGDERSLFDVCVGASSCLPACVNICVHARAYACVSVDCVGA